MTPTRDQQPPHNGDVLDRPLPQSPDAERAVLGSILINNGALERVSELKATDFFRAAHETIFAVMLVLAAAGTEIDPLTVKEELSRRGKLEQIGGTAYVSSLVDGVPDVANVERYAAIVREKSALRQVITLGYGMARAALDQPGDSAGEIAAKAALRLSEIAVTEDKGPQPISAITKRVLTALEARAASGKFVTGISTSLDTLDGYSLGLQRGALSLLCARTKVGKTVLADEIALAAARRGERVLFVELDMPERMHGDRLLVAASGVDSFCVRTGTGLSPADWSRIATASAELLGLGDRLIVDGSREIAKIVALIRRLARNGLDLVILDHIGHVQGGAGELRYAQLGDVSSRLIGAAVESNVAALALVQLKREAEDRAPTLADIYESGNLEQNCRLAILADRPFRRSENDAQTGLPIPACRFNIQVAKNEGEEGPWVATHLDLQLQRVTSQPERRCSAKGCPYVVPTIREERMFR